MTQRGSSSSGSSPSRWGSARPWGSPERSRCCRCCGGCDCRPRASIRCSRLLWRAFSTAPRRWCTARAFSPSSSQGSCSATHVCPYKGEIERFHTSLASLAEIVVFVGLGLTVNLGSLDAGAWVDAALLLLVLALVARPLVVALTLARARLRMTERVFIAWSGLKGAVPILLAAFAVIGGVPGSDRVYGIVFVVVLLSVVCQGTFVPLVARSLQIPMHERPLRPWRISVGLGQEPEAAQEFTVGAGSRAENAATEELAARQERLGHPRRSRRGGRRAEGIASAARRRPRRSPRRA